MKRLLTATIVALGLMIGSTFSSDKKHFAEDSAKYIVVNGEVIASKPMDQPMDHTGRDWRLLIRYKKELYDCRVLFSTHTKYLCEIH